MRLRHYRIALLPLSLVLGIMKTLLYYLGISALFTHELDAVLNFEWRLLFHVFELPEATAGALFIAAHFPLFFVFFYLGHHRSSKVRDTFRTVVCCFLVIHSVLHFGLSNHELYFFDGILSNLYIFGAAAFGLAFLLVSWRQRR